MDTSTAETRSSSQPLGEPLGAGRSGQVFLLPGEPKVARKVFGGDALTKLVHYLFTGAPNAYFWNEDAIRCAFYRRQLLKRLVPLWFPESLSASGALAWHWHDDQAYALDTEFIKGRPVALDQPFKHEEELEALRELMARLQLQLIEAGFDGLVWQAGKGNPVALNNFLLTSKDAGAYHFALIDLESGVPALFALDPRALFGYYLPMSFKHRRPLFDDVDTPKLQAYLAENADWFRGDLGEEAYRELLEDARQLQRHQRAWKELGRLSRSVRYALKRGRISEGEAAFYERRPLRWYGRLSARLLSGLSKKLLNVWPVALLDWLLSLRLRWLAKQLWCFMTSHAYRLDIARSYVRRRVDAWQAREQLTKAEASRLKDGLKGDHSSGYLTDFGVHLGLKVLIQALEYTVFSLLLVLGLINPALFVLLFVADGPILRTLYTLSRMVGAAAEGRERPWTALIVGLIPFFGNLAYPLQMLHSARGGKADVAAFITYDTFARFGQKLPIWGGKDTLTEHVFNRLANRFVR